MYTQIGCLKAVWPEIGLPTGFWPDSDVDFDPPVYAEVFGWRFRRVAPLVHCVHESADQIVAAFGILPKYGGRSPPQI